MGRKNQGNRPNIVLSIAIMAGLSALVRLSKQRRNHRTKRFSKSIEKIWRTVKSELKEIKRTHPHDFRVVQNAEPNLRKQYLKMLWWSTRPYGNKEKKRVYKWREGTVGPLNALLNFAGAQLRFLAVTHYPFPTPDLYQIREFTDGSKRVLAEKVANTIPVSVDVVKKYWRAGYRGNGKHPRVLLAHPTLPELDFVDMIRAHVIELCRQCFIYNVPRSDAHKYIKLLIHHLRPFLDWVYTEGEHGRPYFNRYSDGELRKIVIEIRSLYGKRSGREESVTTTLDDDSSTPNVGLVRSKLVELLKRTDDEDEKKLYGGLLDHIDEGRVVDRDVEKLVEQVLALSSREGNDWHRILLSDLHHPKSLKQVIFAGDTMLDSLSSVLIIGELPVAKRKGQVDLVIFIRREIEERIIWTPIMILEIKTKTSFDFNLYGVRTSNKNKEDYVPSFYAWKRTTSEEEWKRIFTSNPLPRTLLQLDAYESELTFEYEKIASFDPSPPKSLWKGVIVLDTDQRPLDVFHAFQDLLNDFVMGLLNDLLDTSEPASYILDSPDTEMTPRIAAFLTPSDGPAELLGEACVPKSLPIDDPFSERVSDVQFNERDPDNRILTSYVCVSSPVSYGNTAEWISKNWHLLNHIQECITHSSKTTKVHWLDLTGEFTDRTLTKKRFGLEMLLKTGKLKKRLFSTLDRLLDQVDFVDLSTNIELLLEGVKSGFDGLAQNLSVLSEERDESIVIVDGWTEFRNMVPSNRHHLVREVEDLLLDSLPSSKTNIIWVNSGVKHTRMNKHYQRSCISPLPHDSPRRTHVDEIIYNVPTATRSFGRPLPRKDDERFIIQDTRAASKPWVARIHIPHLVGFSTKFRGLSKRKPTIPKDWGTNENMESMYGRLVTLSRIQTSTEDSEDVKKALSLIPSLFRLRSKDDRIPAPVSQREAKELIAHAIVSGSSSTSSSRLTIHPDHPIPRPNKADEEYVPAFEITREWRYDLIPSQKSGEDDDEYIVRRPPTIRTTDQREIDTYQIRERELRRVLYAVRFLKKRGDLSDALQDCCEKIEDVCLETLSDGSSGYTPLDGLIRVAQIILKDINRARLLESIRPIREGLVGLVNSDNRSTLQDVMEKNPHVLLLYGNNLFLAVLAVMEKVYGDYSVSNAIYLWESVVEWELYQLGFKAQQGPVISKYDFHAIFSNLILRARNLPTLRLLKPVLAKHNAGQIVWIEYKEKPTAWVVFQTREKMVAGFIEDLPGTFELYPKWHRCINDPTSLRNAGNLALQSIERESITITTVGKYKVLWMIVRRESGKELAPYIFEYKTPRKGQHTVPWIGIKPPWKVADLDHGLLIPPVQEDDDDIEDLVDAHLKKITSKEKAVIDVTCEIDVDATKKLYVLDFKDKSDESIVDTMTFKDTDKIVHVLRHVIKTGEPFKTPSGNLLVWDNTTDVVYCRFDDTTKKIIEEVLVSFLKPLVHRKSYLPGYFTYPKTCEELLKAKNGSKVRLIISKSRKDFKVEFKGLQQSSSLKKIERLELSIYDIGFLAECEQLIDIENQTRHKMSVSIEDSLAESYIPDMSDFPRFHKVLETLIESKTPDYDYDPGFEEHEHFTDDEHVDEEEKDEDEKDEELEKLLSAAQTYEINAGLSIRMGDNDQALINLERSWDILLPLKEVGEESKIAMLRVLLLKDEVFQKTGSTGKKHIQVMKDIVEELDSVCEFKKRPLYQQRVIENVITVLNHENVN